jgi:phage-related protein
MAVPALELIIRLNDQASAGLDRFAGRTVQTWGSIEATSASAISRLQAQFNTGLGTISSSWSTTMSTIQGIASRGLSTITGTVERGIATINTRWSAGITTLTGAWSTAWTTLTTAATRGAWPLVTSVSTTVSNIVAQFTGRDWGAIGRGVISGIAAGISGAASSVIDAAIAVASRALQAAKDALGIKSPSSVAAQQIGLPIAQGIAAGLAAGLPAITDQIGQFAGGIGSGRPASVLASGHPGEAPRSATPRGGGDTLVFHFPATVSATDARHVEAAVDRALARAGRTADARIRTG